MTLGDLRYNIGDKLVTQEGGRGVGGRYQA